MDSEVYMTRRGHLFALLFIFRTSKNYKLTERVGFEPTNSFLLNDFESFAFDHSATSPPVYKYARNEEKNYGLYNYLNFQSHPASLISLIAKEFFSPRSSTVILSGVKSPKFLTISF